MKSPKNFLIKSEIFDQEVARSFHIYNGLFLTLPFEGLADAGVRLPQFANVCEEGLSDDKSPSEILTSFFQDESPKVLIDSCFRFLQLIERQVVLFDAIEDAAFDHIHDLTGPGTLPHMMHQIEDRGLKKEFKNVLERQRVRIVLTAHPTQFYPASILSIINDLAEAIHDNDLKKMHNLLLQMGHTRFKNSERPTPLDEAKSLVWYLINVFYPTLPMIQKQLEMGEQDHSRHPALELGFWPGGDRDGNPFVTASITLEVAHLLKTRLLHLYVSEVRELRKRLTFSSIKDSLREIEHRLLDNLLDLSLESKKIDRSINYSSHAFAQYEDLLDELLEIRKKLSSQYQGLFIEQLDEWIMKIRHFGFHFASLDLRQDSSVLSAVFLEWLDDPKLRKSKLGSLDAKAYLSMSETERIASIKKILSSKCPPINRERLSDIARDTFDTLEAAKRIQELNGPRGLERFVISNTRSVCNIWELLALCHSIGWSGKNLTLDMVPLFETVNDLNLSEAMIESLYDDPYYRSHIDNRGKQIVMLGFSDGTKDGGYLTANWLIYRCKMKLSRLSREKGVDVIFFDGRGGPPARGGGNTHAFYRAMGPEISQNEIQLTIQGQTISSNFGNRLSARHNLEQLLTAGFEHHLLRNESDGLNEKETQLIEELSQISYNTYMDLKNHNKFISYLEEITPLSFYSELNFASRPTRRKKSKKLTLEDLRAIPFVGSWTQMKQNIPGFYGIGTAIATLDLKKKLPELRRLYQRSGFIRTLFENAMMTLEKSNLNLTSYLHEDAEFSDFYEKIEGETRKTLDGLLSVNCQKVPMESEPVIRASIRMRERLILPLLIIQHYALAQLRKHKQKQHLAPSRVKELKNLIIKAMAASINASRNSA